MKRYNSLVFRILIIALTMALVSFTTMALIARTRLNHHFQTIDEAAAIDAANRFLDILEAEISNISTIASVFSLMDENAIRQMDSDYREIMNELHFDFLSFSRNGQGFYDSRGYLRIEDRFVEISDTGEFFDQTLNGPFSSKRTSNWGFVRSEETTDIFLISTHVPLVGERVAVGRNLEEALSFYLKQDDFYTVKLHEAAEAPGAVELKLENIHTHTPSFKIIEEGDTNFIMNDRGKLETTVLVQAPYLENGILISLEMDPRVRLTGRTELLFHSALYLLLFLMFLGVLSVWLLVRVSKPLKRLMDSIDSWDGLRLPNIGRLKNRKDELGQLALTFHRLSGEIMSKTRALEEQALRDGLTGLFNRRGFDAQISKEWDRHMRLKTSLAVIMADIDQFKLFNDAYGHLEGDSCLRQVAQGCIKALRRPGDVPFRYGGEEFAFILTDTNLEGARLVAETIRKAIEDLKIPNRDSRVSEYVTMSFGVSARVPGEKGGITQLVGMADKALYEAKQNGRNRVFSS